MGGGFGRFREVSVNTQTRHSRIRKVKLPVVYFLGRFLTCFCYNPPVTQLKGYWNQLGCPSVCLSACHTFVRKISSEPLNRVHCNQITWPEASCEKVLNLQGQGHSAGSNQSSQISFFPTLHTDKPMEFYTFRSL